MLPDSDDKKQEEKETYRGIERRKNINWMCPKDCPVEEHQASLFTEVKTLKSELEDLSDSVKEIVEMFEEAKHVVNFIVKASKFIRWLSATLLAIGAGWVAIVHIFKK